MRFGLVQSFISVKKIFWVRYTLIIVSSKTQATGGKTGGTLYMKNIPASQNMITNSTSKPY